MVSYLSCRACPSYISCRLDVARVASEAQGTWFASIRQLTSNMSSMFFLNFSLLALGALAAGSSGTSSSMTFSFLSCLRTILKFQNQSRKFIPFSFSFSRSDRNDKLLFAI
ncbi:hypothetical protein V6N13_059791 [Hibiscus sabdariffa]